MGKRIAALIALVVVVVVLFGIAFVVISEDNDDGDDGNSVSTDLREALGLDSDDDTVSGSGSIEGTTVRVTTEQGGRVRRVVRKTGDDVAPGDVIAVLEDKAMAAQLNQAEAGLESAQADLNRLEAGASAGQIRALETAVKQASLVTEGAKRELDDAENTDLPRSTKDALLTAHQIAKANQRLAEAELALAEAGPADHVVLAAEAAVSQARAGLSGLELQLDRLTVRSPITGTVTAVVIKQGETIAPGATVAHVTELDPMHVVIYVPGEFIKDVEVGWEATIEVDSFDDSFEGSVRHVSGTAEYTPRNVQTKDDRKNLVYAVTIEVPNEDGDLKPGMPADAEIEVDQ